MNRPASEILRAERRVEAEGMEPIEGVAVLLGEPVAKVIRWSVRGFRGLRLDAAHRSKRWYSSTPAARRFLRGLYELDDDG